MGVTPEGWISGILSESCLVVVLLIGGSVECEVISMTPSDVLFMFLHGFDEPGEDSFWK